MGRDIIRTVRLMPYRKGAGPTFTLIMWDAGRTGAYEEYRRHVGYELRQHDGGRTSVIFMGEDFSPSPMHAMDEDASVGALLGFLTLRPGDTDSDYFANYTPAQIEFAEQHAETLGCEAMQRFEEV